MSQGLGGPRAALALHDVTPAWEPEVREALGFCRRLGLPPPALLVVPNHHGAWPLAVHETFCRLVRDEHERGAEVLLHGLEHRAAPGARPVGLARKAAARWLTAGEGEFQTLGLDEARRRLRQGREAVEEALGVRPTGFVAPAWLEGPETEAALAAEGFTSHEDHLFVRGLVRRRAVLAPALSMTARSPARTRASVAFCSVAALTARAPVDLRLALHPVDFRSPALVAALGRLVRTLASARSFVPLSALLD